MPASVEEAVTTKLKATAAVTALASTRVYPQLSTQEPTFPQLVVSKLGADGSANLAGNRSLKSYTVRVECYAETELAAVALGKVVRAALGGQTPWQDKDNGVHGSFFVDSAGEFTEDGIRFQSETFNVVFRPTT